jgi:hypothetical protein
LIDLYSSEVVNLCHKADVSTFAVRSTTFLQNNTTSTVNISPTCRGYTTKKKRATAFPFVFRRLPQRATQGFFTRNQHCLSYPLNIMKSLSSIATVAMTAAASTGTTCAFVAAPTSMSTIVATSKSSSFPSYPSSALSMGFMDLFSPEAREARDRKKREQIEEQERLQKAIMERRQNPQLMEEYEQKVQIRRALKMKGDFEGAQKVEMYEGYENLSLLDGTMVNDLPDSKYNESKNPVV